MKNNKQNSLEQFWGQLEEKSWENASMNRIEISISVEEYLALKEQAKAMHKEEIQLYAEFCVECDRQGLPLLEFSSWIAHNETFNTKEK